ncbi:hypothetical protein [Streptomyces sp. NPDC088246]|uniref:hypothetical protein n=1 Tax=Streptomyces sp. NPDC088246 TaxID=3365842 RepID=UPI00380557FF
MDRPEAEADSVPRLPVGHRHRPGDRCELQAPTGRRETQDPAPNKAGWGGTGELYEDDPKTDAGARTIALDSDTVRALKRHRAQ